MIDVTRKRPKFRFGSVRGSADFGRFGSVRFGKNFAELLPKFLTFVLIHNIRVFGGQIMLFSASDCFLCHSSIPRHISRQIRLNTHITDNSKEARIRILWNVVHMFYSVLSNQQWGV